ncbi:GNAT family acetyltransferase [Aspergillus terreus]|uniref:GNAT family acetyltransferase n=1 Tax=Aspergillus terreus TaxID=33178 RepID=A0A5M3Z0H2_ASPTE|nr:hypothetical protein ATETN484_0007004600 [Aspergillus terreus]GFF15851.1 GNAT family acetyltransferase [Aspergillus terreus]
MTKPSSEHEYHFVWPFPGQCHITRNLLQHFLRCLETRSEVKMYQSRQKYVTSKPGPQVGDFFLIVPATCAPESAWEVAKLTILNWEACQEPEGMYLVTAHPTRSCEGQGISLAPISLEDLPRLQQVHDEAFADNVLMNLMYGPPDPPAFIGDIQKIFQTDSTARMTKAIDDATGEIVGWSWWSVHTDAATHMAAAKAAEERVNRVPKNSISPALWRDMRIAVNAMRKQWITEKPAAGKDVSAMTYIRFTPWNRDAHSCLVLQVLVTRPSYQRRGVGKALVMAGVEEANRLGLSAWLEATPAGHGLYQKCGFRDVGQPVEMDLRQYGGEGIVKTICMLRNPEL